MIHTTAPTSAHAQKDPIKIKGEDPNPDLRIPDEIARHLEEREALRRQFAPQLEQLKKQQQQQQGSK